MIRYLHDRRFAAALVAFAAGLVYLNSLANGFALDDTAIILNNPRVHDLSNLRAIWLRPYWPFFGVELGLWRPVAIFGYAVQWAIGDGAPLIFHTVSVLLHVTASVLAYLLLATLVTPVAALAGALLFAVHPVHTEAVANVVGQAELITAATVIGACLVHATRPAGLHVSWPRRIALVVLFAIGILTKEHAVVLPALLLITDLAQRRITLDRRGVVRYLDATLMPLLLLGCVLLAYLATRYIVLDGALFGVQAGPQFHYLREEYRVLNAFRAYPEFLRLLVFPADLSADYTPATILPVESFTVLTAIGALLLAATVILALLTPWQPAAGFAAAWFFISIVTVSNLFFPIGVLIAERTLYLASFALSAAVSYAWMHAAPKASTAARRAAPILLAVVCLAFGWRTWVRNPDWKDTETLLFSVLRDHPESYKAQWTQAVWQWQRGNTPSARDHFELAFRLYPRDSQLLTEYGNFLIMNGELERGIDLVERAYEMHPFVPRTVIVLGMGYVLQGRHAEALELARLAEREGVDLAVSMPIRAAALQVIGPPDADLGAWRYVIQHSSLHPPSVWYGIASGLARRGYAAEARGAIDRGLDAAGQDTALVRQLRALEDSVGAAQNATGLQNARNSTPADSVTPP